MLENDITAVISTSPIFCNPSTEIIDETYAQLRKQLPDIPVVILMDGVHPEQPHLTEKYEGYKQALRAKNWPNVTLLESAEWRHQSGMLKYAFEQNAIKTPIIFWTEHDLPLMDAPIPWQGLVDTLLKTNVVYTRFELTGDEKSNCELGRFTSAYGVPLMRTVQHTAWPQVVRADYLQEMIAYLGDSRTYYDDGTQDVFVVANFNRDKDQRICTIFVPSPDRRACRRCYHVNGRERGVNAASSNEAGKPYCDIQHGFHYATLQPLHGPKYMCDNKPYKPVEKP